MCTLIVSINIMYRLTVLTVMVLHAVASFGGWGGHLPAFIEGRPE